MGSLTLEQAARASGRSPRELRLLIEGEQLRGALQGGRWTLDRSELERLDSVLPRAGGARVVRPLGSAASPADPPVEHAPARPRHRDADVAELREELDAVRAASAERVAELERELSGRRLEVDRAQARLAQLRGRQSAATAQRRGISEALTPLFRPS